MTGGDFVAAAVISLRRRQTGGWGSGVPQWYLFGLLSAVLTSPGIVCGL